MSRHQQPSASPPPPSRLQAYSSISSSGNGSGGGPRPLSLHSSPPAAIRNVSSGSSGSSSGGGGLRLGRFDSSSSLPSSSPDDGDEGGIEILETIPASSDALAAYASEHTEAREEERLSAPAFKPRLKLRLSSSASDSGSGSYIDPLDSTLDLSSSPLELSGVGFAPSASSSSSSHFSSSSASASGASASDAPHSPRSQNVFGLKLALNASMSDSVSGGTIKEIQAAGSGNAKNGWTTNSSGGGGGKRASGGAGSLNDSLTSSGRIALANYHATHAQALLKAKQRAPHNNAGGGRMSNGSGGGSGGGGGSSGAGKHRVNDSYDVSQFGTLILEGFEIGSTGVHRTPHVEHFEEEGNERDDLDASFNGNNSGSGSGSGSGGSRRSTLGGLSEGLELHEEGSAGLTGGLGSSDRHSHRSGSSARGDTPSHAPMMFQPGMRRPSAVAQKLLTSPVLGVHPSSSNSSYASSYSSSSSSASSAHTPQSAQQYSSSPAASSLASTPGSAAGLSSSPPSSSQHPLSSPPHSHSHSSHSHHSHPHHPLSSLSEHQSRPASLGVEFRLSDMVRIGDLGVGQNGTVVKALFLPTLRIVALKVCLIFDKEERHQMIKELKAFNNCNSPHIISFVGAAFTEGRITLGQSHSSTLTQRKQRAGRSERMDGEEQKIKKKKEGTKADFCFLLPLFLFLWLLLFSFSFRSVLEFMNRGDLNHLVKKQGALSTPMLRNISKQVLKGLKHIHKRKCIHRGEANTPTSDAHTPYDFLFSFRLFASISRRPLIFISFLFSIFFFSFFFFSSLLCFF